MRVLLVEDDIDLAEAIRDALVSKTMAVDVAHDGSSALMAIDVNDYDVVVLDRDIPLVHGDEVARRVSGRGRGPRILMLTAARLSKDKIAGFQLGADDYLSKPFDLAELEARLWALGRRPAESTPPALQVGSVTLDPFRHTAHRFGAPLTLSRKEFAVLHILMSRAGTPVSAEQLLEKAWDENANPFTNSIRVTVSSLRKKLGPPYINTFAGVGYTVVDDET
ncbi:response regulator transcription factor [Conyzicola nivalis]|uniref:Transcriptional regulatory protein CutR n=1 Tax=Conyzicola nivalis TaxID=1477021 RepID=A0A916SA41_9MICO|nr:response regulator transcription factor [Conyzicola nivalis]GGA90716.1 transcriptional regulatory protein CutR [Conyzicola nivalis]